ncbi:hypothetical protein ACWD4O_38955 [Streptomyces sp. NPDC002623]
MGALNLVPDQSVPADPKTKTGGRGGGQSFADMASQIYHDDRADGPARELLLAFAYVITMQRTDDPKEQWRNLRKALGAPAPRSRYTDRVRHLIQHDTPRYIAPDQMPGGYDPSNRTCVGPRVRAYKEKPWKGHQWTLPERVAREKRDADDYRNKENVCGAAGKHRVLEKQLGTGWYHWHWFCPRHHDHAVRVQQQVKAQNDAAPDPVPNAGGLMACYFEADWVRLYRHYQEWPEWEPPVYGVRADDWPIPGKQPVPQRARLRLVLGGADLEGSQ